MNEYKYDGRIVYLDNEYANNTIFETVAELYEYQCIHYDGQDYDGFEFVSSFMNELETWHDVDTGWDQGPGSKPIHAVLIRSIEDLDDYYEIEKMKARSMNDEKRFNAVRDQYQKALNYIQ